MLRAKLLSWNLSFRHLIIESGDGETLSLSWYSTRPRPLVTLASRALSWQFELLPPTSATSQPSRADAAVPLYRYNALRACLECIILHRLHALPDVRGNNF